MHRKFSLIHFVSIAFVFLSAGCTKIDTTSLGGDLIPAVDNIHTFQLFGDLETDNKLMMDSTRNYYSTNSVLGEIFDDPEFGKTTSDIYFNLTPPSLGTYPFYKVDSVVGIDSVVLSLAYTTIYGDSNSKETFRVYEIAQSSDFKDSSYLVSNPVFQTVPTELGNKTITFTSLKDTNTIIRQRDTTKVPNVLRIPLSSALGNRFMSYDTTSSANGGFHSDSIFRTLFKGLAVKVDQGSPDNRALSYFNLSDQTNTSLIVYYRVHRNGIIDTTSTAFHHSANGQASLLTRTPAHGYDAALKSPGTDDDKIYIQSDPGSYALIKCKGLDTLSNKVIHLAELIITRIPSAGDNLYPPEQVYLDMVSNDSAFTIQNDFQYSATGSNFSEFGGILRSDDTYRFNITRHVQGLVTRREPNFSLRLYEPYLTFPYYLPSGNLSDYDRSKLVKITLTIVPQIAFGRTIVGGGSNADPKYKMKLRIVYSKI